MFTGIHCTETNRRHANTETNRRHANLYFDLWFDFSWEFWTVCKTNFHIFLHHVVCITFYMPSSPMTCALGCLSSFWTKIFSYCRNISGRGAMEWWTSSYNPGEGISFLCFLVQSLIAGCYYLICVWQGFWIDVFMIIKDAADSKLLNFLLLHLVS